ncbi:MAG: hypothetical protein K0U98_22750 [Deltaproteobacteria bacterium]|nr:hypothetical protein [Deltaproteobacteria bacterium]
MAKPKKQRGIPWILALSLTSLVAMPSLARELTTFVPPPESVSIQKADDEGGQGNARIFVTLDNEGVTALAKVTGEKTFLIVGDDSQSLLLRDDGKGDDDRHGDGVFTGRISIDDSELIERGENDRGESDRGAKLAPVFDGRVRVGTKATTPFDANKFLAGERVAFGRALTSNLLATEEPAPAAGNPLSAATGQGQQGEHLDSVVANAFTPGTNIFQDRSLMITDVSVVTDPARTWDPCTSTGAPMGQWTFGHLMREMANEPATGIDPSFMTEEWLKQWGTAQNVNSFNVPARAAMASLIADWRAASGGGDLDLSIAPFRLLAIVSRVDLRSTTGTSGGYLGSSTGKFLDAGEARFVFGVVLPPSYDASPFFQPTLVNLGGGCRGLAFSVIFEYRVPKCECEDVRDWAKAWVRLANLPFPSASYNATLNRLTNTFVRRNANPTRPNGSALGQLRTNEIGQEFPWELREFRLMQIPWDTLHETTAADTPDLGFNNTVDFSNYVLFGPRPVPLIFNNLNFLAANPKVPGAPPPPFHWNGPLPLDGANNMAHSDLRSQVGVAACNGCHARETDTVFVHVDPATPGLPAALSGFLTGITVADPVYTGAGAPKLRDFDDLERREADIKAVAKMKCFKFRPFNRHHVLTALEETGKLPEDPFKELEPVRLENQPSIGIEDLLAPPIRESH